MSDGKGKGSREGKGGGGREGKGGGGRRQPVRDEPETPDEKKWGACFAVCRVSDWECCGRWRKEREAVDKVSGRHCGAALQQYLVWHCDAECSTRVIHYDTVK